MKTKIYQGWLSYCPYGFLSLDADSQASYPDSLAGQVSDDWKTGDKASVRYYVSEVPMSLSQASESLIMKTFGGDLEAEYVLSAYSEWTVEEWQENLKVGGHNLIDELDSFCGKYAIIVIETL